jgi:hypothetical protein
LHSLAVVRCVADGLRGREASSVLLEALDAEQLFDDRRAQLCPEPGPSTVSSKGIGS